MDLTFLQGYDTHRKIYLFAILLIFVSMPLSAFGMSAGQFILVANWLAEGNLRQKWQRFVRNKAAVVLVSLYLIHLAGLLYTTDFDYALKDLRIKLPLLIFPVLFSSIRPFNEKEVRLLLHFYLAAVFAGVIIGFYNLFFTDYSDIREISRFISHIRFSLHIVLGIYFAVYFLTREKSFARRVGYLTLIILFFLFLIALEAATGLIITFILAVFLGIYYSWRSNRLVSGLVILLITAGVLATGFWLKSAYTDYFVAKDSLDIHLKTPAGNNYSHWKKDDIENGYHIYWYINEMELKESWNRRSRLKYSGKDLKGQTLKYTLIRFLNSKGLKKDAAAVNSLDDSEIRAIEQGIANAVYLQHFNPKSRLYKIFMEYSLYKKGANPSGHSLLQRLYFWKHGFNIIMENPFTGVGTGDVNIAFQKEYEKSHTALEPGYRFRAHNQYLTFLITFGIPGLLWFLFVLFYPPIAMKKRNDYFYLVFFITILLSMLTEDTLETQAGATFYAFLNSFFLFLHRKE